MVYISVIEFKFKIVDNNVILSGDKRTLKPGVGCENSATYQ